MTSGFENLRKSVFYEEIRGKVQNQIQQISPYSNEELAEYVLEMVKNRKPLADMEKSLEELLPEGETHVFVVWLMEYLDAYKDTLAEEAGAVSASVEEEEDVDIEIEEEDLDAERYLESQEKLPSAVVVPSKRVRGTHAETAQPTSRNLSSEVVVPHHSRRPRREMGLAMNTRMLFSAVREAASDVRSRDVSNRRSPPPGGAKSRGRRNRDDQSMYIAGRGLRMNVVNDRSGREQDSEAQMDKVPSVKRRIDNHCEGSTSDSIKFTVTVNEEDEELQEVAEEAKRKRETLSDDSSDTVKKRKMGRCSYWPNCMRGSSCMFVHPTEPCKMFPNCTYGNKCLFIHGTTAPKAQFARAVMPIGPSCKFGFACRNRKSGCKFHHPPEPCRFGTNCKRAATCTFAHGTTCRNGVSCSRPGCRFVHTQTAEQLDKDIDRLSSSLPTTPPRDSDTNSKEADSGKGDTPNEKKAKEEGA